eukprot:6455676-Amphidinium_carterae.2
MSWIPSRFKTSSQGQSWVTPHLDSHTDVFQDSSFRGHCTERERKLKSMCQDSSSSPPLSSAWISIGLT